MARSNLHIPEYQNEEYLNSPDRDILTPLGLRILFGEIGEKTVYKLVDLPGFPVLYISNSYRFPRREVLEWANGPGIQALKSLRQSSSSTKTVP